MKIFLLVLFAILILFLLLRWVVKNVRCPHCGSAKVVPVPEGALKWSCLEPKCKKDFTLGQ